MIISREDTLLLLLYYRLRAKNAQGRHRRDCRYPYSIKKRIVLHELEKLMRKERDVRAEIDNVSLIDVSMR